MTQKFFKTYYSLPDKHNRIDVVFERGYKNLRILYNDQEIATYVSVAQLMKTTAIETPDESLIHIRFLKDLADFEVFFNAVQVDRSEHTPEKAVPYLKWPVIACLCWYLFVIMFFIVGTNAVQILWRYPSLFISDSRVLYLLTSSLLAAVVLIVGLIKLKSGNPFFYYLTIIITSIDAFYGIVAPFNNPILAGTRNDYTLPLLLVPLALKVLLIWVFISNIKTYKQFSTDSATIKRKSSSDLVDRA